VTARKWHPRIHASGRLPIVAVVSKDGLDKYLRSRFLRRKELAHAFRGFSSPQLAPLRQQLQWLTIAENRKTTGSKSSWKDKPRRQQCAQLAASAEVVVLLARQGWVAPESTRPPANRTYRSHKRAGVRASIAQHKFRALMFDVTHHFPEVRHAGCSRLAPTFASRTRQGARGQVPPLPVLPCTIVSQEEKHDDGSPMQPGRACFIRGPSPDVSCPGYALGPQVVTRGGRFVRA